MLSYCLKCRKSTESKNSKAPKTKNGKILVLSRYEVCGCKKSKFIQKQETSRLLSQLGIKTLSSKIPIIGRYFVLTI